MAPSMNLLEISSFKGDILGDKIKIRDVLANHTDF